MTHISKCIGCGCDDHHVCLEEKTGLPCSWIVVDRDSARGVCSCCTQHLSRWEMGDRSMMMMVARITKDGESLPYYIERNDIGSMPYLLGNNVGDKYAFEWVEMTETAFEALPQFEHCHLAKQWRDKMNSVYRERQKGNVDLAKIHLDEAQKLASRISELGYDAEELASLLDEHEATTTLTRADLEGIK